MSKKSKGSIVLGGVPRLNLLPPSHFEKIKTSQTISSVLVWIILAVVIAMAGIALMWVYQNQRAEELARVQAENTALQAERDNYPEVIELRQKIGSILTVEESIPAHLDYAAILGEVLVNLPEEGSIESVNVVPIGSGENAQISVTATIHSGPFVDSAEYMANLAEIPGFVRYEFQRSELRTDLYEHTLVLFFDGAQYPIEEGVTQ